MAKFEIPVVAVREVLDHPNADRLNIVKIGDYNCISNKLDDGSARYKAGDLVIYIPEGSIVPDYLLRRGFWNEKTNQGGLAGSKGNRVKAIKLRGILSQGIMFPVEKGLSTDPTANTNYFVGQPIENGTEEIIVNIVEGQDLAEALGVTKYEPVIPASMDGKIVAFFGGPIKFDLENIKKFPDAFRDGEEIVATEKLHGTQCQIGFYPPELRDEEGDEGAYQGDWFVTSKGYADKGLVFDLNEPSNESNLYVMAFRELEKAGTLDYLRRDMISYLQELTGDHYPKERPFTVIGEVYGAGVQDLTYGKKQKAFAAFKIFLGDSTRGFYFDANEFRTACDKALLEMVPLVYKGPYSKEIVDQITNGDTMVNGVKQIREGVVIEAKHTRKFFKSVSEAYLLRKGETTEFN